jgi:hypothetical protein
MLPEKNSVSENPDKDQHVVLNAQKTVTAYPPLQFCWLRLLLDLLYIPKWRGSKETAVFAGELGAADIADVIRRSRRIHRLDQHEPPSFLQTKLLLILKGGHVGERLEMVVEPGRTHVRLLGDKLYRKWLVEVLFQPDDGLHDAAGIAIRLCHSLKLFALLATPQAVQILPMQKRCEYSTVLRPSEEPEQAEYRIE